MSDHEYSTAQVAEALGISKLTLLRWLQSGKLAEPKRVAQHGKIDARVWSESDLRRAAVVKVQMRRGRPSKNANSEAHTNGRLLQLRELLNWYGQEVTDTPLKAVHLLQVDLDKRLS
jgi:hypothetical protein